MRLLRIASGAVAAIVVLAAVVWLGRRSSWCEPSPSSEVGIVKRVRELEELKDLRANRELDETAGIAQDPTIDRPPPIADKPPYPKASTGTHNYHFGSMEVNGERKHKFRIANQGQAPLLVARGPTQCKCTISSVSKAAIPPGGFAEVEISWSPREADPSFQKAALIWTNDPEQPEIRFRIAGKVLPRLTVRPRTWHAGVVTDEQDGKAVGIVGSESLGDCKILSAECSDPNVAVTYKPMGQGDVKAAGFLAAYKFEVTVSRRIPLGRYSSRLRIGTTAQPNPLDVEITAMRTGPIHFLPAIPLVGSAYWNAETSQLNLGQFDHALGSKAVVPALVYSMKDRFEILGVDASEKVVSVSLERPSEAADAKRQNVRFLFEVAPGTPAMSRLAGDCVHLTVRTNHPTLKQLKFDVAFVSR